MQLGIGKGLFKVHIPLGCHISLNDRPPQPLAFRHQVGITHSIRVITFILQTGFYPPVGSQQVLAAFTFKKYNEHFLYKTVAFGF
ncbi:MAG: hypothetical protein ABF868_02470 [Sporolactobacillus sp.]